MMMMMSCTDDMEDFLSSKVKSAVVTTMTVTVTTKGNNRTPTFMLDKPPRWNGLLVQDINKKKHQQITTCMAQLITTPALTNKTTTTTHRQRTKATRYSNTVHTSSTKPPMDLTTLFPDVTPIPQNDGPHPVCAIDYPEKFVEAMNYLRALIEKDEHSGECACE